MPDLPADAVFYAAAPDGQEGPMMRDELVEAVQGGRFRDDVQVWWPEADGWIPFSSQPELAAQLASMRPPAHETDDEDEYVDVGTAEAEAITDEDIVAAEVAAAADATPRVAATRPQASDEELDSIFADLVKDSWRYHHLVEDTTRVDEVLLGALITATLETGHALIDLTSDGTNHFLRFEDPSDRSRVTMAVTHLTRDVTTAKAVGQRASVVFGYGEPLKSFVKVFGALRQEAKSGYLGRSEPGVVTFDADGDSHYLYTQVELFLDLDQYISPEFAVDYSKLSGHVGATVHALRKFLRGKVAQEEEEG